MISRTTIDQVYETARVEEVIGDFVALKKSGSNYKGLSPFSQERTPSFMVSPVKQIWKDFSSGKGGNVVAFLMEHEHFSYPEAIRFLAKRYNIEIEETEQTQEEKEKANAKESLYLVNQYAKEAFEKDLWEFDVKEVKVPEIKDYVDTDIRVDIGEEKVEKTYEMYLEEKKVKKENEIADENLKKEAAEEEWNQLDKTVEEQDDKTNNDDSGDSGNHHN